MRYKYYEEKLPILLVFCYVICFVLLWATYIIQVALVMRGLFICKLAYSHWKKCSKMTKKFKYWELDAGKQKRKSMTWLKSFVNESIDSLACQIPSQICGRWCLTDGNWLIPEEGWTLGICKTVSGALFTRPWKLYNINKINFITYGITYHFKILIIQEEVELFYTLIDT